VRELVREAQSDEKHQKKMQTKAVKNFARFLKSRLKGGMIHKSL